MRKNLIPLVILVCIVHAQGGAQVSLSGQTAAYFYKSGRTDSPRALNSGRPTFGWRSDLFVDGIVNDNIAALGNIRMSDDGSVNIDYLAIQLANLTPLDLSFQAGKFDMPFGNLGERRFPRRNPLFGLPVIYEYRTALPARLTSETEVLANRGRGLGMRLLDLGIYDVGAMAFGSFGVVSYALAVTNGTVSATSYGSGNSNSNLGKLVRLAVTPFTGVVIGGAYSWGAYMDQSYQLAGYNIDVNEYQERTGEFDIGFSRGHAELYGEVVHSTWAVPLGTREEDFGVLGYYVEGKYTVIPRVYAALRTSALRFGNVTLAGVDQPWDYDVTEWEGGLGYFLDRDVLVKLVRRETRTSGGTQPKDYLTVLQLVVAY